MPALARQPPRLVTFLAVLLLALGTTGGALISVLRPQVQRYATARILAAREVHNLSGSRDYDLEVAAEIVFTIEAGLSFFHTHAEGMGVILLFAGTAVSSLVARGWLRRGVSALVGLSFLFPVGYLAYSGLILGYGKDRGIALAEQWLLIPFGSAAIAALLVACGAAVVALAGRRRAARAEAGARGAGAALPAADAWSPPPGAVLLAAILLIALAEIAGASLGRWTPEIRTVARAWILATPAAHGLVGSRDVDDEIVAEALVKLDGGLRLFHLHAEGIGLVIFAGGLVISTLVAAPRLRRVLHALLAVGGFGFPFGYLLWSGLIPSLGIERARRLAEAVVLIPFGVALVGALWLLSGLLAWQLCRGGARRGEDAPVPAPGGMALPPVSLVLASMLLLVVAEVGGASMVRFKTDIERANRQRVEARAQVHGLVGVRQVDAETVDRLLARADFALRLFHLHGEGMALVMFAGGMTIRRLRAAPSLGRLLYAMLGAGGFLYPFGYLAWSLMIPALGLDPSKDVAEYAVWIPFGGAALAATGIIAGILALELVREGRRG